MLCNNKKTSKRILAELKICGHNPLRKRWEQTALYSKTELMNNMISLYAGILSLLRVSPQEVAKVIHPFCLNKRTVRKSETS